jgi:hypothetical protein
LAFTPLGFSLPDLTVDATVAPVAAYAGPLGVRLDVRNLGASSLIEPINLPPGAGSSADAPPSEVEVFISSKARFGPTAIPLTTIPVPAVPQNSKIQVNAVINLPPIRPLGFPGSGGKVYFYFLADPLHQVLDTDRTNNLNTAGLPVQIAAPLPDLAAVALDTPPVMQPGDWIQPSIKVANFGTVDTAPQGPVLVDLVASTDTNFGPGDRVLATYVIDNISPLSEVPTTASVLGDVDVEDPINIRTVTGPIVQLPKTGAPYFLGVIVDPLNTIREIHEIGTGPSPALNPVRNVQTPIPGLPPAGIISFPALPGNVFPFPAFGTLSTLQNPTTRQTLPPSELPLYVPDLSTIPLAPPPRRTRR